MKTPEQKAKAAAYMREWVKRNKEKVEAAKAKAQKENPDGNRTRGQRWRDNHPGARREYHQKWYAKGGKEKIKWSQYLRRYGLTPDMWRSMVLEQAGECGICEIQMTDPHIDHIHGTKIVRGLLCGRCNRGIGMFDDSPGKLRSAAVYVERN